MKLHRLSASGLTRAKHCLYWARPELEWPPREPERDALFGTAVHAHIEGRLTGEPTNPECPDDMTDAFDLVTARWEEWWKTAGGTMPWKAEAPVAWNVRTGAARWLPKQGHREYGELEPYEIPGTIDAHIVHGHMVLVWDWKTGRQAGIDPPKSNAQLAHNGAAAATAMGLSDALVSYAKLGEDAVYLPEPHGMDALDIDAARDELATMIDGVAKSEPTPGPWCHWCPAKSICPTTKVHVAEVVDAAKLVRRHPVSLEIRDNAHAADMLTAIDGVESFVSELKRRLKAYADANGGIELPDGTVYSRSDVTTERVDLEAAGVMDLLVEFGAADALKHSIAWSDIKKEIGAKKEKAIRERLRALGAVKSSSYPRYESKPRKTA